MHNECETVERQAANDSSWDHPITQLSYHWYSILRICYPCPFFISVVLLNISGHSKVCHFTRFSSTSQYIWSCQVSVDNLLQTEDYSKYLKPSWTLQSHKKKLVKYDQMTCQAVQVQALERYNTQKYLFETVLMKLSLISSKIISQKKTFFFLSTRHSRFFCA